MDQIVGWLKDLHIELSTVVATVMLLVGAAIVIVLVDRLLKQLLAPAAAQSRFAL